MNLTDIVVIVLIAVLLFFAIKYLWKARKKGGCCGNCNGCRGCEHKKEE